MYLDGAIFLGNLNAPVESGSVPEMCAEEEKCWRAAPLGVRTRAGGFWTFRHRGFAPQCAFSAALQAHLEWLDCSSMRLDPG